MLDTVSIMSSFSHYTALLVVLTFGYVVYMVIYAFVFSPIRNVPGPFLNRISRLPLYLATYRFRGSTWTKSLIDEYGPIVVCVPNQVLTTDETAMKVIYDRTTLKTSFYSGMGSWKGVIQTVGFLDYRSAAPSRTNLISCFANTNLDALSETISEHVTQFVALQKDMAARGETVDGMTWFRFLALDIITDVLWGDNLNLLTDSSSERASRFVRSFNAFSKYNAMKSSIPGFETCVQLFGNQKWRRLRFECSDLDFMAHEALQRWERAKTTKHSRDVLSMLKDMDVAVHKDAKAIPDHHLPAYMVEMMAAGSSTTSLTAAYACRALARSPERQRQLRQELFDAFPDPESIRLSMSRDLPFLDAVIRETMRMWPMIPGPLERYLSSPITVGHLVIPAGVVASTSALCQGRLEDVFLDAELWKPECWLSPNVNDRMKLNWIPFGTGSRACPGSNLAMTELRYMIGRLFRWLKAVPPPGHEDESLELMDVFAVTARTSHCWLKIENAVEQV